MLCGCCTQDAPALPVENDSPMTDAISSKQRLVPQRSDELWSRLQTVWLEIPHRKGAGRPSPTWEVFSERFDRCFRRVSFYVSRRVNDRESFARIVTEVLAVNLELFIGQCSELEELKRLKASADRLLALAGSTGLGADTFSPADELNAAQFEERG
jgi:hypothetical protein